MTKTGLKTSWKYITRYSSLTESGLRNYWKILFIPFF